MTTSGKRGLRGWQTIAEIAKYVARPGSFFQTSKQSPWIQLLESDHCGGKNPGTM